jgi:predicted dehydrogenase
MSRRPRWGVLGTGWIAERQTADLVREGFDVVAVGSRSRSSAERFAIAHGIARAHGGYRQLVADDDVDIVYVASPQAHHHEHATLAMNAGKHVLLEKPFALNAAQARDLASTADACGVALMEAMWSRFLPHLARVRQIVTAGALGRITVFEADSTQLLPHGPADRLGDPAQGGGSLLDVGVYPITVAHWLLGEPTAIAGESTLSAAGVDLHTVATLTHTGGAISVCVSAIDGTGPNRAVITGTEGRIEIDGYFYGRSGFRHFGADGTLVEELRPSVPGRGMHLQAAEFERVVGDGRSQSDIMPVSDSIAVMETLDAIRARIGAEFPVDATSRSDQPG